MLRCKRRSCRRLTISCGTIIPMPPEDASRIEELKKSLYSRSAPDVRTRRKLRFSDKSSEVPKAWERPVEAPSDPVILNESYKEKIPMSFLTKLLIASALFCMIAVGAGAFLFFQGANLISADNIDIVINGPVSVSGGEPIEFDIKVANKNNVDLQVADLSIEFPDGTIDPKDTSKELKEFRELLGDIPAGRSANKKVEAIVFGEENMQKQIEVTVTYSVKGSSAVFTKTRSYDVLISSSPINVSVDSFTEVTSGQEFDLRINITSNSTEVLKNVLLKAEYPFGFEFTSSQPKALFDTDTWKIGDIPAGEKRTITIRGVVKGENTDVRVFRFRVGAQHSKNQEDIGTEYASIERELAIQKPFVSVEVYANNDEANADYVARYGESTRVEIAWFNNLSVPISNMTITARLTGTAYDKTAIQPDLGTYRSGSDEIVWNQISVPELGTVRAGDSGKVSFTVTPMTKLGIQTLANPSVSISVDISGNRTQESRVPEKLTSTAIKNIKIASDVSLSGRSVRTVGPFTNTGPIPPRAEQKTTYTILWTVNNGFNAVHNAEVTASLPAHVTWVGQTSPSSENISYDRNKGTVTWDIGNIAADTSGSRQRREVAFQVMLEPGVNLVGQAPILVDQTRLIAIDDFTGSTLESTQDQITTRFSTDPAYKERDENVVQ